MYQSADRVGYLGEGNSVPESICGEIEVCPQFITHKQTIFDWELNILSAKKMYISTES